MPVNLIIGRIEQTARFIRIRGVHVFRFHHPDADPFLPAGIYVTRIFDGHGGIGGMQASRMFVIKPLLAPDEHFP